MQKILLPSTALNVSSLCFGCGSLGTGAKGDAALELVQTFFTSGGNFFDTAHCYAFWAPEGSGASERELGRCLQELGIRNDCVIATKGGHPAGPGYPRPDDFLAENVLISDIDDSLNRLGIEVIDLYYLHRDDGLTPVGEVIEQLSREVARGRIRHLGASNWSVERIAAANAYAAEKGLQGFCISQVQWSLAAPNWFTEYPGPDPVHRAIGSKEIQYHRDANLPIAAFSATVGGYFSGSEGGNNLYDNEANRQRRERTRALATEIGATPAQVALAWLCCQPVPTIPIFATNRPDHLQEIIGAADITLTEEQLRWLRDG